MITSFGFSAVDLINMVGIAAGIGICGLCFLQISASIHLRKVVRQYFQFFFLLILLYINMHLVRLLMDGLPGNGVHTALVVMTFVQLLTAGFMSYMMSMLVVSASRLDKAQEKRLTGLLLVLLIAHAMVLIIGAPTRLIYYYDQVNTYCRAPGYLLSNICPLVMLIVDIVLLVKYHDNIADHVRKAFWVYLIAPIAAVILQGLFFGVQFVIFAAVGGAVYMFSVIVKGQNDEYESQQEAASRVETELATASGIQQDMLPSIYPAFPERPELDIYASMDPAKEVGGDFYDFFLQDEDHLCLVIADVAGKGIPAALFMMVSKIMLANHAMLGKSPAQILTDANKALCANNRQDMFVTVWLGILEVPTGKLVAANAGHEYPALRHADGEFELLQDEHDLVLGCMGDIRYNEYEIMLEPGSRLLLYTDGVRDAATAKKGDNGELNMFGKDRILAAANRNPGGSPREIIENVQNAVNEFLGKDEKTDDLTMLCIEYRGSSDQGGTRS